jgi:hypothetical protein
MAENLANFLLILEEIFAFVDAPKSSGGWVMVQLEFVANRTAKKDSSLPLGMTTK